MVLEIQFSDDRGGERAGEMGAGGVLKSSKNFFAGGNAANHRAALQDQNFFAGLGEIGRRHQAIYGRRQ